MNDRLSTDTRRGAQEERGSALIIAVLISVIMSLLGISYLMMAQTESTIAENERNSALSLYVAEAGARLVVNWFNDPSASSGYLVPTAAQVDRTKRVIDQDNDPNTARVVATSGYSAAPYYKDGAITTSPIFERPYRNSLVDPFLGIETGTDGDPNNASRGPDLIVNSDHLATINDALFLNFPTNDLRARISRIEVYSPPLVTVGTNLTRMGIATIKVTAGVFMYPGTANEKQIATRVVKAVVNEIPVPGPVGPLQSCNTLAYNGNFEVHWGMGSSSAGATIPVVSMDTREATGVP
ncbi:MAG TPA: hypothetical protein VFT43_02570, partial [Candidatus Polarisedimenticolia bacterium]|nr:hypothetical protein [Candidatus Polarisedimenticolia bacterium]